MPSTSAPSTVVHLPFYDNNPYQSALMRHLDALGYATIEGGGGGTFFGTALRQWKPAVMHFHWLHPYLLGDGTQSTLRRSLQMIAQLRVLRARGTRIVWTAHNLKSHESPNPRLERALTWMFLGCCDAIIAHCDAARREIVEFFGVRADKVWVVPHGNYVGAYPDDVSRAQARAEFGLGADELCFGFVGQIRPYKGVLELIEAFETLQGQTEQPLRLLIAGAPLDEASGQTIAQRVAGNAAIRFDGGFVPDDRLQFYLRAADVVVFPYRDILTSGAVLLAMSYERACLAPRRGCIPETLGETGGFLYDPQAPDALIGAMQSALARRDELPLLGHNNGERAGKWSWQYVAQRTSEVYRYAQSGPRQRAAIAQAFRANEAL